MKNEQSRLQEYYMIKKSTELPTKVNIYFNILEMAFQKGPHFSLNRNEQQGFINAFSKLNTEEKIYFMNESIKFVVKVLFQSNNKDNIKALVNPTESIINLQTTADISTTKMKIPCLTPIKFKLDKKQRLIFINSHKKTSTISLQKYLVRKSKKFKSAIILDLAIQASKNDVKKYTFHFEQSVAEHFYKQILSVIIGIHNESLYKMIDGPQSSLCQIHQNPLNSRGCVFLSPKNINEYLNAKQKFLKYLLTGKFDFKLIHKKKENSLKIQQSRYNQKIFKMQSTYNLPAKQLRRIFLEASEMSNRYLISSETLENFSKGKYRAMYEKYIISNKNQELISIKQTIYPKDKNQAEETFLFVMGIQNIMVKIFMEFLVVKARSMTPQESKLIIICSMRLNNFITVEVVKHMLEELSQIIIRKPEQALQIQQQFYTVYGNSFETEQIVQFIEADDEYNGELNEQIIQKVQKMQDSQKYNHEYLKHKYKLAPKQKYKIKQNLMKQHFLFKQWKIGKEGGVVCTNDTIINQQKKLFKHILTTFGNNILKGNSILNISLPVNIFKKQSHLYSIARDFCYAPLLLQNINHPLQRIKKITILAISIGTLGISMDKPFNPILGQTLQVWIGGCPMYLEQISHHPPITSYIFYGRGYKIYGQIQPKISFGMNNVKGYSERPNYIKFDDGTQIELIFGKMVINGMLFGERMFDFSDKIFVFDKKNNFFSEINYGPKKKNMIMKNSEPKDFVFGKIFKVKSDFRKKFQENRPYYPTKEYIVQQISEFQGRWTQAIKFQKSSYIDFVKELPCLIQDESHPLPSNSHYRKDLSNLLSNNIEESQRQKQILEQIQRRDRKLREQNLKK